MHFSPASEDRWASAIGILVAILATVGLLGPHTVEAQPFRYGVRGGLSLSTVDSEFPQPDVDQDLKRHRGLSLLVFGEWRATSMLSLLVETGYAQRGYQSSNIEIRDEEGNQIKDVTWRYRFGYASTTLLGKIKYSAMITPYLVIGPHLGVLLHSSVEGPLIDKRENLVTQNYDPVTAGATVGVGVQTDRLLPGTTSLEVRYGADLTDSLSDAPRELRNRTLDVLVGLTF